MDPTEYHFVFIDIVGLSNPLLDPEKQVDKINKLNEMIKKCKAFKDTSDKDKKVLPTGDGAAIGFKGNDKVHFPLELAIQLHKKLKNYNFKKQWLDKILLHIGIHSNIVYSFTDLKGNQNVWGNGIIIAQRIMSKAPADFILLSEEIGKRLSESEKYKKIIYHAGMIELKYQNVFVWYAYDDDFGRNDISNIKDLNEHRSVDFKEFSAEVLGEKRYKLGDKVTVKVDFTGKLENGFFTIMLRAPESDKFPNGEKNQWIPDPNTYSSITGKGNLCDDVKKISNWSFTIEKEYPQGMYTVYIRVYNDLSGGRRPVIAEKVEKIYVTDN